MPRASVDLMIKRVALLISLFSLCPVALSSHVWLLCEGSRLDLQITEKFSIRLDEGNSRAWWFSDNVIGNWEYVAFSADFIKYSSISAGTQWTQWKKSRFSWQINRSNGVYESFWQLLPDGNQERDVLAICKAKKNLY